MARIVHRTADHAAKTAYVDPARLAATTDAEIERQMAEDGEEAATDHDDWHPSALQVRHG